jgi:hypothetical protein
MVLLLFVVDVVVTLIFRANVEAQGAAYATGVLVLILSAAIAVTVTLWREFREDWRRRLYALPQSVYFGIVSLLFVYTLVANVIERPDGAIISAVFILLIIVLSAVSRYFRSQELRVSTITFVDEESERLWPELIGKKVSLVPVRGFTTEARRHKAREIRTHYKMNGKLAFLRVDLLDNRSDFIVPLRLSVRKEGEDFVIEVLGAVAVPNTIAYCTELIDPAGVFLTLTRENLMLQSLRYLLWGEGEIGLMVYTILVNYWEWTGDESPKPVLYLMSV